MSTDPDTGEGDLFGKLQNEIVVHILKFITDERDICNFALTCKRGNACLKFLVGTISEIYQWVNYESNMLPCEATLDRWKNDVRMYMCNEKTFLLRALHKMMDDMNAKNPYLPRRCSKRSPPNRIKQQHMKQHLMPMLMDPVLEWLSGIEGWSMMIQCVRIHGSLNSRNHDGLTLLHRAVRKDDPELLLLLVKMGAKVNVRDNNGHSPFYRAVRDNQKNMVRLLHEHGANQLNRALHWSVMDDNTEMLQLLLELKADIDTADVLDTAISLRKGDLVRLLLNSKAMVRLPSLFPEDSAMDKVMEWADTGIIKLLLENVMHPQIHMQTAFNIAILDESTEKMHELLCTKQIGVNQKDLFGKTPFHWAVYKQNRSIISLLLEISAGLNTVDNNGTSPILLAVHHHSTAESLNLLLETRQADVNLADFNGITPLHAAISKRKVEFVNLLLDSNASVYSADHTGLTPLGLAFRQNNIDMMKLLISYKADVNEKSNAFPFGFLHCAVTNSSRVMINHLLEMKAEVTTKDNNGETLLMITCHNAATDLFKSDSQNEYGLIAKSLIGAKALVLDQSGLAALDRVSSYLDLNVATVLGK